MTSKLESHNETGGVCDRTITQQKQSFHFHNAFQVSIKASLIHTTTLCIRYFYKLHSQSMSIRLRKCNDLF